MSRDRKIVLGVVVLAVLGGLVYRQINQDSKKGAPTTLAADMPDIKGSEDIDKVSLTNGDKGEVVLQKEGDKWMVVKPVKALANQGSVKSMIDNMKELKAKEIIASQADDALKKDYNLDPGHVLHVVAWKGADKKVDDFFGKTGSRGEMMMVEGKPGIYSASGFSSYLYNRSVSEWRDKEIFKFDEANVVNVTIDNKNGKFSFTKDGEKWAGTFKGKPIERFDEEKVKDVLRTFKLLNADDFGDEKKTAADTGLDKPEGIIAFTLKDNAGKYGLQVGKTATGNSRFALKDGDGTVYVVSQSAGDWATAETSKFQKALPTDGGAGKDASPTASVKLPPGHP
jgi:Domain of unknown function (DUF4340)